jgi:hypothetical protein
LKKDVHLPTEKEQSFLFRFTETAPMVQRALKSGLRIMKTKIQQ